MVSKRVDQSPHWAVLWSQTRCDLIPDTYWLWGGAQYLGAAVFSSVSGKDNSGLAGVT